MAAVGRKPTVRVRGEAVIRAEPDEAILWITVSALESSPGPALADVSRRSRSLAAILDELQIARADRSTTGVNVAEEFEHTSEGRRSVGHRASSGVSVRVSDPELLGRLVARAAEEIAAHISGPRWQIASDNPVRLEAARQAAADAARKARAYAEGVGAALGAPLRLAEPDDPFVSRRSGGWVAAAGAAEPMPVDPGEHEVFASVVVTFALESQGVS